MLVNLEYTLENVSNLVSTLTKSLGSRNTLRILDPSVLYLILLPTISVGYTISSNIDSCTAVNVLDLERGPFCVAFLLKDFGKIVR